ncbi:MAG TPA: EAL domain-containing protein, partial [Thermoanaerobaculia bacterium]|nr:EAL domain-containing protein [Thermoanaerobaculia bacterium]
PRCREVLDQIKQLGVKLAVDDFGKGYTSLNQLRSLPLDTLKIDRSLVMEMFTHRSALLTGVIGMARALGITVLAEGIETEEQCQFLAGSHCDLGQGYFLGIPLPASHFLDLFAESERSSGSHSRFRLLAAPEDPLSNIKRFRTPRT